MGIGHGQLLRKGMDDFEEPDWWPLALGEEELDYYEQLVLAELPSENSRRMFRQARDLLKAVTVEEAAWLLASSHS